MIPTSATPTKYWKDFMEAMDKFGEEQLLQNLPLFYVYSCEVVVRAIRLYFHIREGKCHAIDRQKFDALMHAADPLPNISVKGKVQSEAPMSKFPMDNGQPVWQLPISDRDGTVHITAKCHCFIRGAVLMRPVPARYRLLRDGCQ